MKDLDSNSAVVVFSGGQDSTTCLYWAKQRFGKIITVTFDYGQKHRIELQSAARIAKFAGVENLVLPVPAFQVIGDSALVGSSSVSGALGKDGLPNSFVPGRNLIFLTYAAAYAYKVNARYLVTGVCETDFSGYPDCREDTIEAVNKALNLGMEAEFKIETPLMFLTKAATVRLAKEVGALEALAFSHTCYNGLFPPCRECPACQLRAKGFLEAGLEDPLLASLKAD